MFKVLMTAFVLVSTLSLTACDTARKTPDQGGGIDDGKRMMPVPATRVGAGGAVLVVLELKDSKLDKDATCRWRAINTDTKRSYFIDVKVDQAVTFAKLDPGPYKLGRLGCGISRIWDLDDVFSRGFVIRNGEVAYLGKLIFEFRDSTLQVVRKGTRDESAKAFVLGREATQGEGMVAYVSAFTGKNLDPAMVSTGDNLEGFDVFAQGVTDPQKTLKPLVDRLQICAKEESVTDPVRFGHLEYNAQYKSGRFTQMTDRKDPNAFSDKLKTCVEREMMAFHPAAKNTVDLRVRY